MIHERGDRGDGDNGEDRNAAELGVRTEHTLIRISLAKRFGHLLSGLEKN